MKAIITRRQVIPTLPSASGVEWIGNQGYIIGDDSPWLYVLNDQWAIVQKAALFTAEPLADPKKRTDWANNQDRRMAKKIKPDYETITQLQMGSTAALLIAGSGSKSPQRDNAFLIQLGNAIQANWISLTPLYDQLRAMPQVVGSGKLNVEGLAANHDSVCLLQRGNITGNNVVIQYDLPAFVAYLTGQQPLLPTPIVSRFELPFLAGIQAGFSGATFLPHSSTLLFTASVENTADEISDGESLGSLVGMIDLQQPSTSLSWAWITENGLPFTGKVESIAIQEGTSITGLTAIAVTDNDCGDSEILEVRIDW
ncbi:MAG: hypothetical protein V4714_03110 [Bacteroidota bacterium]